MGLTLRLPVLLTLGQERLADSYRGLSAVLTPLQPPPGRTIIPAASTAAAAVAPSPYTVASSSSVSVSAGSSSPAPQGSASPLQSRPHQKNRLAKAVQELPELLLLAPAKVAEQVRPCALAHPPRLMQRSRCDGAPPCAPAPSSTPCVSFHTVSTLNRLPTWRCS